MKNIYSIKDNLGGYYDLILEEYEDVAKRNFINAVKNPNNVMFANPQDFNLVCLGSFDHSTGLLISNDIRTVISGSSVMLLSDEVKE